MSKHFYNLAAARNWLEVGLDGAWTEPITQQPVAGVLELPDPISDTRAWFDCVDLDGHGHLSRETVVSALRATLPLDLRLIDAAASDEAMWRRFDPDGSGTIELEELSVAGGLLEFIQTSKWR